MKTLKELAIVAILIIWPISSLVSWSASFGEKGVLPGMILCILWILTILAFSVNSLKSKSPFRY